MNLALIGMRGVGKSNISRRLAFVSKRPVLSTDLLIEYETGMTIPDLVTDHGWPVFRDREAAVIQRICAMDHVIVDCGGGVVVDIEPATGIEVFSDRKVEALRERGPVVWLRGDIDRLAAKTAGDPSRPVLDSQRDAAQIMRSREPFYKRAADVIVDVEGRKRSAMAMELAMQFADVLGLDDELVARIQRKHG